MTRTLTLYIDGVDWQHELGAAADGTLLYPTESCLKEYNSCWDQCGIVEVEATFGEPRWVHPQEFETLGLPESVEQRLAMYRGKVKQLEERTTFYRKLIERIEGEDA